MVKEAKFAFGILKKQLVLKIPATTLGFRACTVLSNKYTCAMTSIFSPSQAMVANAAGATFALYYHNRAKRLLDDGADLPRKLVQVLKHSGTTVIAASLKSTNEIVEAREAGVKIMTTTFEVLQAMTDHQLSNQALRDFQDHGVGISY